MENTKKSEKKAFALSAKIVAIVTLIWVGLMSSMGLLAYAII